MKKLTWTYAILLPMIANAYASERIAPEQRYAFPFIYSVKYICGLQNVPSRQPPFEPPLKPGNYATSINIHNYHGSQAATFRKAVVANGQIGSISSMVMTSNQAISIDCNRILGMLKPPFPSFIEGFVEFGSTKQLSVTAVYTSQSCLNATGETCSQLGELSLEVVPQKAFLDQ